MSRARLSRACPRSTGMRGDGSRDAQGPVAILLARIPFYLWFLVPSRGSERRAGCQLYLLPLYRTRYTLLAHAASILPSIFLGCTRPAPGNPRHEVHDCNITTIGGPLTTKSSASPDSSGAITDLCVCGATSEGSLDPSPSISLDPLLPVRTRAQSSAPAACESRLPLYKYLLNRLLQSPLTIASYNRLLQSPLTITSYNHLLQSPLTTLLRSCVVSCGPSSDFADGTSQAKSEQA